MTKQTSDHDLIVRIDERQRDMLSQLTEIKTSVKGLPAIFASKEELIVVAKETEGRLCKLENAAGLNKYLMPIISAVCSSLVTFLVINYLSRKI